MGNTFAEPMNHSQGASQSSFPVDGPLCVTEARGSMLTSEKNIRKSGDWTFISKKW